MAVSYNKMSSIQIGGTYVNYVPIGARGNVSLDCSGNSLFRGAAFMDASLNVSGIFNVGGDVSMNSKLFVGGDVSMNSKLFVGGDVSMNSKLQVGGDVSMNSKLFVGGDVNMNSKLQVGGDVSMNGNLSVLGNTTSKILNVINTPTDLSFIQMGHKLGQSTLTMLTTGTTSNVASGTAFKPASISVLPNNTDASLNVKIPINLCAFFQNKQISGTITITYTGVSMNIYKNGVLQSAIGQSITPTQFTGGDTKTATNIGGAAPFNFPSFVNYYFGYFDIVLPITAWNPTTDVYEIELSITGSATHTSGSQPMFLSIASTAGEMGYNILSPRTTFTQTRNDSSTYPAQITFVSAATTPYNGESVSNITGEIDGLVSNNELTVLSKNSLLLEARIGFWTAKSPGNFYFKTLSSAPQIILGNANTDFVEISSTATTFSINTLSKPMQIICNGFTVSSNTSIGGDFLIEQTNYTQPMLNILQLGYTDTATTTTNPMTNTLAERSNFNLPSKGVWLVICGYEFSSNAVNTIELKQVVLSLTSASGTAAAYGLAYFEQIDDAAPSAQVRQRGTITGVVTVSALTTIYVNARSTVNSGTNTKLITNVSWTRIG
jgi:hypothetical protein